MEGESCGVRVLNNGESGGTVVPGKFFLSDKDSGDWLLL